LKVKLSAWVDPWRYSVLVPALILALPVLVVLFSFLQPQWQVWQHLLDTVLADYVVNSLILAFGVGFGALSIGVCLAWILTQYQIPGRRYLQWLVLLPLAMPAYIIAYTYTGLLDFSGPLQTWLRQSFNWSYGDYWFPEIRSLGGAICMLALVLYPYVYMLARSAFREQSASLQEASRTMGLTQAQHFIRVALPLARPAILTGTALAMMEAFADYGTVQYFGVSTFTTGIFRTWFGMGNGIAAAQLSAVLTSFVLLLLLLEKWSRKGMAFYHQGQKHVSAPLRQLPRAKSLGLSLVCCLPVIFGFLVPLVLLAGWALDTAAKTYDEGFLSLVWNSFILATMAAVVAVLLALIFAYAKRLRQDKLIASTVQLASLGYAVPGTVIAIGVMVPLIWFDKWLNTLLDDNWGLVFSGSLFAVLMAYSVRFLAVALHNVESGLGRIKPSMDQAARSLGHSPLSVLRNVHFPLLTPSLLSALLLVFVDVLKELPATLILRPFNFNTLAVRTFELASDERLADSSLSAIAIVGVGLLPVILLAHSIEKARQSG